MSKFYNDKHMVRCSCGNYFCFTKYTLICKNCGKYICKNCSILGIEKCPDCIAGQVGKIGVCFF